MKQKYICEYEMMYYNLFLVLLVLFWKASSHNGEKTNYIKSDINESKCFIQQGTKHFGHYIDVT